MKKYDYKFEKYEKLKSRNNKRRVRRIQQFKKHKRLELQRVFEPVITSENRDFLFNKPLKNKYSNRSINLVIKHQNALTRGQLLVRVFAS